MEKFKDLSVEGNLFIRLIEELKLDSKEVKEKALTMFSSLKKEIKKERVLTNQNLSSLSKYLKGLVISLKRNSYFRYYNTPSTQVDPLDLTTETKTLDKLCFKLASGVTPGDTETLSIDVVVDNNSILTSPILIDETTEALALKEIKLPARKLLKGSILKLNLTHNSGTTDSLAGIYLSLTYRLVNDIS